MLINSIIFIEHILIYARILYASSRKTIVLSICIKIRYFTERVVLSIRNERVIHYEILYNMRVLACTTPTTIISSNDTETSLSSISLVDVTIVQSFHNE